MRLSASAAAPQRMRVCALRARASGDVACGEGACVAEVKQKEVDAAFRQRARQQRRRQPAEGLRLAVARVHAAGGQGGLQLAQVEAAASEEESAKRRSAGALRGAGLKVRRRRRCKRSARLSTTGATEEKRGLGGGGSLGCVQSSARRCCGCASSVASAQRDASEKLAPPRKLPHVRRTRSTRRAASRAPGGRTSRAQRPAFAAALDICKLRAARSERRSCGTLALSLARSHGSVRSKRRGGCKVDVPLPRGRDSWENGNAGSLCVPLPSPFNQLATMPPKEEVRALALARGRGRARRAGKRRSECCTGLRAARCMAPVCRSARAGSDAALALPHAGG
jgi:hypothetical protein